MSVALARVHPLVLLGLGAAGLWYWLGRPSSQTLGKSYPLGDEDIRDLPSIYHLLECCPPHWTGRTSWNVKDPHGTLAAMAYSPADDDGSMRQTYGRTIGGGYA